jgi:transposase
MVRAKEELLALDSRLKGPRPRIRSHREIGERIEDILDHLKVNRYLTVEIWQEEVHKFKQERKGRPGPRTRYRRETKRRPRIRWQTNQDRIDYDEKSDGMYPLLTNDRSLTPRQVLEVHKRQPNVEKRFQQIKTVHEIAPVLLKNEGRIEALFFLYFVALLVQGLIERQIRQAMERDGIEELPIYPEERMCRRPTSLQILRLFTPAERHFLIKNDVVVQRFPPVFTELQQQLLQLLGIPPDAYAT